VKPNSNNGNGSPRDPQACFSQRIFGKRNAWAIVDPRARDVYLINVGKRSAAEARWSSTRQLLEKKAPDFPEWAKSKTIRLFKDYGFHKPR